MKKLSILLSTILVILSIGCAFAEDETPQKPVAVRSEVVKGEQTVSDAKVTANLKSQIAEYDKSIKAARAELENVPAWQDYLKKFDEFKKLEDETKKLPEYQKLKYLALRRDELVGILNGK